MKPNRKLNRLPGYDYRRNGPYFVTICANDRVDWFGEIRAGKMILNDIGKIVDDRWRWLARQYQHVVLDAYIIMPDHVHAVILINHSVGTGRDRSDVGTKADGTVTTVPYKAKPLSGLIGAFKTTSSKAIHNAGTTGFRWQKSYYDSILRDTESLERVRRYIVNNPGDWSPDHDNSGSGHLRI